MVEGAFTLQTITPTQPMPSITELDIKFAELVEELDLTAPNKQAMLSLPPEKKWQIYCSRKSPMDTTDGSMLSTVPPSPEHYIERLTDMKIVSKPCNYFLAVMLSCVNISVLLGSSKSMRHLKNRRAMKQTLKSRHIQHYWTH